MPVRGIQTVEISLSGDSTQFSFCRKNSISDEKYNRVQIHWNYCGKWGSNVHPHSLIPDGHWRTHLFIASGHPTPPSSSAGGGSIFNPWGGGLHSVMGSFLWEPTLDQFLKRKGEKFHKTGHFFDQRLFKFLSKLSCLIQLIDIVNCLVHWESSQRTKKFTPFFLSLENPSQTLHKAYAGKKALCCLIYSLSVPLSKKT